MQLPHLFLDRPMLIQSINVQDVRKNVMKRASMIKIDTPRMKRRVLEDVSFKTLYELSPDVETAMEPSPAKQHDVTPILASCSVEEGQASLLVLFSEGTEFSHRGTVNDDNFSSFCAKNQASAVIRNVSSSCHFAITNSNRSEYDASVNVPFGYKAWAFESLIHPSVQDFGVMFRELATTKVRQIVLLGGYL